MIRAILVLLALSAPARAEYLLGNLRFTLLHELGHAVIDQYGVALFGPEEIAADGFAIVLGDHLLDEAEMAAMIRAVTRLGRREAARELFDPWGDYMPGGQRLAYALCLYHGLRPEGRAALARALGMPSDRAEACEVQARRVRAAWAPVLAEMTDRKGAGRLRPGRGKTLRLLAKDFARIERMLSLRRDLPVIEEVCTEDNAFYYHLDERIAFCIEMLDALRGGGAEH